VHRGSSTHTAAAAAAAAAAAEAACQLQPCLFQVNTDISQSSHAVSAND
jgi:hypothetical protein